MKKLSKLPKASAKKRIDELYKEIRAKKYTTTWGSDSGSGRLIMQLEHLQIAIEAIVDYLEEL